MKSVKFTAKFKILIILAFLAFWSILVARQGSASVEIDYLKLRESPPIPHDFAPSNARTVDGNLIPSDQFFSAQRCSKCHQETHAQWSESLHRNSAREPFYKESVNILEKQRGIEFTQHCESCHSPIAMASGALRTSSTESREMDDEGVTCTVCHSITEARTDGTGSYTIRRPALMVKKDGTPIYGDITDEKILADIPNHKKALMNDVMKKPEFCATCHKAAATPALNNYKFLRGFNAYDEWQMSGASTETITPYYRREKRAECRTCHMPMTGEGRLDMAADAEGKIASHRFIAANTTTPLFYGQIDQVNKTKAFLSDKVLSVDIFALRNSTNGEFTAPIVKDKPQVIYSEPGQELTAEIVVFNRRAAHSFPPELRDMYEPWVEFEAVDSDGKTIYHSGFIKPDKILDEKAHVYKALLLDSFSRVVTRHQVWHSAIKAYDNFIPPGRSDIVRYSFRIPPGVRGLTLRARVYYRRFIQDYADYVLKRSDRMDLEQPIVKMAEESVSVIVESPERKIQEVGSLSDKPVQNEAARWNDYGIGLMEQTQYGQAAAAFKKASELDPSNPDYLVSAAIAELRMERYAFNDQYQLLKAKELVDNALKLSPKFPRARFYQAIILRALGKNDQAGDIFAELVKKHPLDREIWRQYGQTVYSTGQIKTAKTAFETIIKIDPTDAGAWQFLSPIYFGEGKKSEGENAQNLYLLWRDDPAAESVAARFYQINPNWADVRIPFHAYSDDSPLRPTLTGNFITPDK